jgi:putative ABC transport system permease protein
MLKKMSFNLTLAIESVLSNTLRSILTALGIIFGVGAVIAMLAIGSGARQSILDQMKLIGTNNIVIKTLDSSAEDGEESEEEEDGKKSWSPGLSLADVNAIKEVLQTVDLVSPEIVIPTNIIQSARLEKAKCVGVTNDFFELSRLKLESGNYFHDFQMEQGKSVCIIGKNIQLKFFGVEDPIGKMIKCGNTWLRIIGVIEKRNSSKSSLKSLGIRDYNSDVYIPVKTALLRFENRGKITSEKIGRRGRNQTDDENYHQLDRIVVRVKESSTMQASAGVIARLLARRHQEIIDFEVEVPELLLEQEQKTQDIFNWVLAAIGGISLLVGGIGIMNIMLASVLERIKEIGVRRSMGALKKDIIQQFLFEAVIISVIGGVLGIALGYISSAIIANSADIPTVVSAGSILLSAGVAIAVGLIFGIFPARKAAQQDPIKALRSD